MHLLVAVNHCEDAQAFRAGSPCNIGDPDFETWANHGSGGRENPPGLEDQQVEGLSLDGFLFKSYI